jgi:hypothetical protein
MGILVAKRYPTKLALGAADHTYVECGTGLRAWSCWGGKAGGTPLTSGAGSTNRANSIAEPNEKARITCYLVNGVCHQSANRILLPAGVDVIGAHGYNVSSALFGVYGRPRGGFGLCKAPFNQYAGVTGDLPQCTGPVPAQKAVAAVQRGSKRRRQGVSSSARTAAGPRHKAYLRSVLKLYSEATTRFATEMRAGIHIEDFQVELFSRQVQFHLGRPVGSLTAKKLNDIRRSTERARLQLENYYANQEIGWKEFVAEFNRETIVFQNSVACVLSPRQYKQLFNLDPDQTVILADPDIVKTVGRPE